MPGVFIFGSFSLDNETRTLTFREKNVPIGPKEFDLLAFFAASCPQVLTKAEILRGVWRNANAKEAALTQAIYRLRQILHNCVPGERYIASIPGRGYQFVCPVRVMKPARFHPAHFHLTGFRRGGVR